MRWQKVSWQAQHSSALIFGGGHLGGPCVCLGRVVYTASNISPVHFRTVASPTKATMDDAFNAALSKLAQANAVGALELASKLLSNVLSKQDEAKFRRVRT